MQHYSFSLDYLPDAQRHYADGIFCVFENNKLVEVGTEQKILSDFNQLSDIESAHIHFPIYIGGFEGKLYFAQEIESGTSERQGLSNKTLRELGHEDEILFALLSRGLQLVNWRRNHKYCGGCAAEMVESSTEYAMRCPSCSLSFYPKIMPCIMALVTKGDQCLLARHSRRGATVYTALAGFVEAGESVEHAIQREVFEEVGVRTGEIRYFSSQAWPFPGQLMLGFFVEYIEGEIVPEEGEIEDAQWFDGTDLPEIPAPFTLSGKLVRAFFDKKS